MNVSGHKFIRPKAIHDPDIVEEYAKHYMYFACIQFINSVCSNSFPDDSTSSYFRSRLHLCAGIPQCSTISPG